MLDLNNLHKQWYDWTLKSGAKPDFLKKRVAYYVIGPSAENWKYADDLDSIAGEHRKLYLASTNSQANDVFQSGSLSAQARSSAPDHFTYDPREMRPAELEKDELKNYLTDQRYQLNLFGNGVVYHSEPLPEATEISGFVKASLWMSMDVPDTDFSVNLYEVLPDGPSVLLTSDAMRARYRESTQQEKLVTPGQITRYDFEGFTWFSRRVSKGSRLRFVLTCPNTIYQEKNYNSGGVVASETGKDSRVAHVTVYHDGQHASELESRSCIEFAHGLSGSHLNGYSSSLKALLSAVPHVNLCVQLNNSGVTDAACSVLGCCSLLCKLGSVDAACAAVS
jgi:uncharacterized protein